jgi:hypothetical protein
MAAGDIYGMVTDPVTAGSASNIAIEWDDANDILYFRAGGARVLALDIVGGTATAEAWDALDPEEELYQPGPVVVLTDRTYWQIFDVCENRWRTTMVVESSTGFTGVKLAAGFGWGAPA